LGFYVHRSLGGLAAVRHGPSRCLRAEEAWASSGCFVLTLCVLEGVGLDRPPQVRRFGVFLVVKEVSSMG
jgi:hypothetical protein